MNSTEILLNKDTSIDQKMQAANEISQNCSSRLTTEQILCAHQKIQDTYGEYEWRRKSHYKLLYISFLSTLLIINVNMYIAMILKTNDHSDFYYFYYGVLPFCKVTQNTKIQITYREWDTSINTFGHHYFKELLNYHDFDISNIDMFEDSKANIQHRRSEIYGGKFTKAAIKN